MSVIDINKQLQEVKEQAAFDKDMSALTTEFEKALSQFLADYINNHGSHEACTVSISGMAATIGQLITIWHPDHFYQNQLLKNVCALIELHMQVARKFKENAHIINPAAPGSPARVPAPKEEV